MAAKIGKYLHSDVNITIDDVSILLTEDTNGWRASIAPVGGYEILVWHSSGHSGPICAFAQALNALNHGEIDPLLKRK